MSGSSQLARPWLKWSTRYDLSDHRGNGVMDGCLGVVLHVNQSEQGTSVEWFAAPPPTNPESVTPTFQVYKDGRAVQFLPLDWSPWCQIDGNFHYAAIETAGLDSEPLTDAQLGTCARIMAAYHRRLGVPLGLADTPGQRGLGTHAMGGAAWGGHPCPGTIRTGQRADILAQARHLVRSTGNRHQHQDPPPAPAPTPAPRHRAPRQVAVDTLTAAHGRQAGLEDFLDGVPGYVRLAHRDTPTGHP